jgi:hypothetical protein
LQEMSADIRNLHLGNGSITEDLVSYHTKKSIHGLKTHISQYNLWGFFRSPPANYRKKGAP